MSAEAWKVTQRDLFAKVTSGQRMPTTRASRGWHQVLGTEQKLQVESAERGLKENAKWKQEAYASCSKGNEKSK